MGMHGDDKGGIGDVNGTEKGSAARFNSGKIPLDLIPVEQLLIYAEKSSALPP